MKAMAYAHILSMSILVYIWEHITFSKFGKFAELANHFITMTSRLLTQSKNDFRGDGEQK
jgi:hypothetical protein